MIKNYTHELSNEADSECIKKLGDYFFNSTDIVIKHFIEEKYPDAIISFENYYRIVIKMKNYNVINNLGCEYEKHKYYKKALECYTLSFMNGNMEAGYNLGNVYYNGIGVIKSYKDAIFYFNKVIEQQQNVSDEIIGNTFYALAKIHSYAYFQSLYYFYDPKKAIEFLKIAMNKGNINAMENLAYKYHYGVDLPVNLFESAKLYKKLKDKWRFTEVIKDIMKKEINVTDLPTFIELIIDLPEDMISSYDKETIIKINNYRKIINCNHKEFLKLFLSLKNMPKEIISNEIMKCI